VAAINQGDIKGLNAIKILDVVVTRFDVGPPVTETFARTLADAIVKLIPSAPTNTPQALTGVLIDTINQIALLPPSGDRIAARSLLQDVSGQHPATDVEIEANQFQVSATVNGDNQWQVALDIDPTDISLLES
jgi:hypothetical protein